MATRTVAVKYNGRSGKLQLRTEGFFGEGCKEIADSVTQDLDATVVSEERTAEADAEPPCQAVAVEQDTLA